MDALNIDKGRLILAGLSCQLVLCRGGGAHCAEGGGGQEEQCLIVDRCLPPSQIS